MLQTIDGRWISVMASGPFPVFLDLALPRGTDVYANISLSQVNTIFDGNVQDPKFAVTAQIVYWTVYQADGTESEPLSGMGPTQNAVLVRNCARITFLLHARQAAAIAQINVVTL